MKTKFYNIRLWHPAFFIHLFLSSLTHWGRTKYICVGNLTIIGSDSGLSPGGRQAIIWTNDGILSIGPWRNKFQWHFYHKFKHFHSRKMEFKISSATWHPFCLGLNVLMLPLTPGIQHQFFYTLHHLSGTEPISEPNADIKLNGSLGICFNAIWTKTQFSLKKILKMSQI